MFLRFSWICLLFTFSNFNLSFGSLLTPTIIPDIALCTGVCFKLTPVIDLNTSIKNPGLIAELPESILTIMSPKFSDFSPSAGTISGSNLLTKPPLDPPDSIFINAERKSPLPTSTPRLESIEPVPDAAKLAKSSPNVNSAVLLAVFKLFLIV